MTDDVPTERPVVTLGFIELDSSPGTSRQVRPAFTPSLEAMRGAETNTTLAMSPRAGQAFLELWSEAAEFTAQDGLFLFRGAVHCQLRPRLKNIIILPPWFLHNAAPLCVTASALFTGSCILSLSGWRLLFWSQGVKPEIIKAHKQVSPFSSLDLFFTCYLFFYPLGLWFGFAFFVFSSWMFS